MASFVAKYVGKKILGETLQNRFGKEDPYFETVPASRLDGRPTKKVQKRKKALPPGLSKHDGEILTKVKRRAYKLDMALFSLCGVRFGWGSALGIIPVVGDVFDALLSLMVFNTCRKVEGGLPAFIRIQMLANIVLDFFLGLIPFAGDLIDALYRANTRNAILLENYLREEGQKNLKKAGQAYPAVDPSDPAEYDRAVHRDSPDGPSRQSSTRQPKRAEPRSGAASTPVTPTAPSVPAQARTHESRSFFGRRTRPDDEEMARDDTVRSSRRTR